MSIESPITFEPEYTRGERIALPVYFVGPVFCVGIAIFGGDHRALGILGALCLGGVILVHTATLPRRLRFDERKFIVRRFLWPDKHIAYSEVTDLGLHRIVSRRGSIDLTRFQNGEELARIVHGLLESGKLDEEQLAGRAVETDVWRLSGLIGAGIGILGGHVVGIILAVVGWYPAGMNPFAFIPAFGFACAALGYVVCRFFFLIQVTPDEVPGESAAEPCVAGRRTA